MTCYMCDKPINGCSDTLNFCSEKCANDFVKLEAGGYFEPDNQADCDCPDCLYDRMIEEGFTSPD